MLGSLRYHHDNRLFLYLLPYPLIIRMPSLPVCDLFSYCQYTLWDSCSSLDPSSQRSYEKKASIKSSDEGRLFYAMPNRIATIPMAVNDGFSYNYGNGNMYEHYHYDRVGVYDGEYASFSGKKGYVALATLPRSFWGKEETISQ